MRWRKLASSSSPAGWHWGPGVISHVPSPGTAAATSPGTPMVCIASLLLLLVVAVLVVKVSALPAKRQPHAPSLPATPQMYASLSSSQTTTFPTLASTAVIAAVSVASCARSQSLLLLLSRAAAGKRTPTWRRAALKPSRERRLPAPNHSTRRIVSISQTHTDALTHNNARNSIAVWARPVPHLPRPYLWRFR